LANEILEEVIREFILFFNDFYSGHYVIANIMTGFDPMKFDYPDVSDVFHNQIGILQTYLADRLVEPQGRDFRSRTTNFTFNDIAGHVSIITAVDLVHMDSIIGAFNLTKDRE